MKHGALTLLMVAAVLGFAFAQPGPAATAAPAKAQAPMACGMQGMQGMPGMAGMIPDMTPAQLEKMDALRTAQIKAMAPLHADLKVKEIELQALWRADEPDAKQIIAKVKEIGAIQEKIQIAQINHRFEMRKLMTPEQRKAMKKMGMGRGMMGKGMGRGMRGMKRGRMGGAGCSMQGGGQCGGQCGGPQRGPMMGPGGEQGCPMMH